MENRGLLYLTRSLWGIIITLSVCIFFLIVLLHYNSKITSNIIYCTENLSMKNDAFGYLTFGSRNYMKRHVHFFVESPFKGLQEIPMYEDVIALQNVQILNENWKNPKGGSLEVFGPQEGFGRILVMKSGYERSRNNTFYQHSFGLSISVNIGLNITNYGSIDIVIPNIVHEHVGAVYVLGTINKENVMFCGLVGDYFSNPIPNTVKLLQDIFEIAGERKTVVAGTFYGTTYADIEKLKRKFSFKMEKGPFWTNHDEGSGSADHILVKNCNIVKQPTIIFAGFHRGWLTNAIIDVKKEFFAYNDLELLRTKKNYL